MALIRIIPIEPLFMRAKGEFEPGVSIFAESLILPRPSTIDGFLRNFSNDKYEVYGTWIEKNGEKYFPFRFGGSLTFVKESELPKVKSK
ncbi:hypothetical protein [Acidianus sp. RZ1]|uniref:hypothetical protein n=1 Tax=Acidianus sp. RZ1 TaxID=1540082 RepID=UPI001491722C|nr:hypothetical protein [Acidianus sp. RZ1]NON61257.1 hypothetical protein [Acidianus sp. RZ1]